MKSIHWIKIVITIAFFICAQSQMKAQRMALTSNLLEDALATPNFGVEIVLADRQSLSFDVSCAPYKLTENFHNKKMSFRAGYKFWLTQAFYGHYLCADAVAVSSDVQISGFGSRNEYLGLGVSYGYSYIFSKRWNLIPHVGLGVAYGARYNGTDHMIRPNEGVEATAVMGFTPILTRLGITIQYVLR